MTDTNALGNNEHRSKRGKRINRERSDWIGIKIPAIVSKALFEKAQARLRHNQTCWRNTSKPQLLSNLVFCGKCGMRCYAYRRSYVVKRKDGEKLYQRAVYRCRTKGKNHNPEIDSRILDPCVIEMVEKELLNPEKLYEHLELLKNKEEKAYAKLKNQLTDIDKKLSATHKQKERIINLYAASDLEREEYIKRMQMYESELLTLEKHRLEIAKWELLLQNTEKLKGKLRHYCKHTQSTFKECTAFSEKRKFFLETITKVAYSRTGKQKGVISLHGSIQININDKTDEIANIDFTIEKTIDRAALQDIDRKNASEGKLITSKKYGELVMAKMPEIQNI